jgi:hypothetical protein
MNETLRPTTNLNTTEFKDLNFNEHPGHMGGKQAIVQFSNGYGASIVITPYSYGGDRGLYELAVFGKDGHITYDTPITNDVLGYLTEIEVSETLKTIKELI